MILTTHGPIDEAKLARTVGLEDRPDLYAIWVEWRLDGELVRRDAFRLPKHTDPIVETIYGATPAANLVRTLELRDLPTDISLAVSWRAGDELVKRDVHVIAKEPSVVADAIAASVG